MQEFDATQTVANDSQDEQEQLRQRVWDFVIYLFKRFVLSISFGSGVVGFLWLLGRIFKR